MSRIVLRGNNNRGIFTNNNTPSINPSGDLVMNENTSVFGNNIQPQDDSSNFNVGSDLTTGNLVMGSTDASSNTTIVGGESIDISSNGDINFNTLNTTGTVSIQGKGGININTSGNSGGNITVGTTNSPFATQFHGGAGGVTTNVNGGTISLISNVGVYINTSTNGGQLVMGSKDVSSNTTILGGESIDISSNGDINFTASNSIFTGDIYGNYILANHFNANDASSNLTVGSDLTTGDNYFGSSQDASSNTYIQAGAGGIVKINNTGIAYSVLETDLSGGNLNIEPDKYSMYFYEGDGPGTTRTLKALDNSTGLTIELIKQKTDALGDPNYNDYSFTILGEGDVKIRRAGSSGTSTSIDFNGNTQYMKLVSKGNNYWIVTDNPIVST
jgi:hypothetical protein